MSKNDGATKQDIKNLGDDLRKEIREVMGEFTQEILDAFSPETLELKAITARIENKLDATASKADDHEVRISKLEHQIA